jgi:hypothetical protein
VWRNESKAVKENVEGDDEEETSDNSFVNKPREVMINTLAYYRLLENHNQRLLKVSKIKCGTICTTKSSISFASKERDPIESCSSSHPNL